MIALPHFRPAFAGIGFDPDALAYIMAVEAADGQLLESGMRAAINNFVKGCKTDGIWNAIKASCILAGARTLSGALVPLKGTAPTNNNFVSGDYNRKTGLLGNGATKYLDSNRNVNTDPQDNFSMSVFPTTLGVSVSAYIGAGGANTGSSQINESSTNATFYNRNGSARQKQTVANYLIGSSRSNSTTYIGRTGGTSVSFSQASQTPYNANALVFARNAPTVGLYSQARILFYHIGESLDLELLDSRVTRLNEEYSFAINTGLDATPYDIDTLRYVNAGYNAGASLA